MSAEITTAVLVATIDATIAELTKESRALLTARYGTLPVETRMAYSRLLRTINMQRKARRNLLAAERRATLAAA